MLTALFRKNWQEWKLFADFVDGGQSDGSS